MSTSSDLSHQLDLLRRDVDPFRKQLAAQFLGQPEALEGVLAVLLAGGHLLLEGLPGTGKTALARAVAESIAGTFRRIQFTPDLMPADLIGTYVVLEQHGRRKFEFTQGPIFANLVLADEINRATPKTQAGLLEAMEDGAVTVANERYELPQPFCVIATQSPYVGEGTFPLPETQLDRFLLKLTLELPPPAELEAIVDRGAQPGRAKLEPVLSLQRWAELQQIVRQIGVAADAKKFAVNLLQATQPNAAAAEIVRKYVRQGASLRGAQAMLLAGKARAAWEGRTAATLDDVRHFALPALRHRLVLSFEAHAENVTADAVLRELLKSAK